MTWVTDANGIKQWSGAAPQSESAKSIVDNYSAISGYLSKFPQSRVDSLRSRFGLVKQPLGVASQYYQFTTGSGGYISRLWIPAPKGCDCVSLRYGNWGVNVGSPNGEVAAAPAFNVRAGILPYSAGATAGAGSVLPASKNGLSSLVVNPGTAVEFDPIGFSLPPGPYATNGFWVMTLIDGWNDPTKQIPKNWNTSVALGEGARIKTAVSDPTAAPTLAYATTGGMISPGTYSIAFAYYDAIGSITAVSPSANIGVPTGTNTNSITVTAPALPSGAVGVFVFLVAGGTTIGLIGNAASNVVTVQTLIPGLHPNLTPANVAVGSSTAYGPMNVYSLGGDLLQPVIGIIGDSILSGDQSQDASSSWLQVALASNYQFILAAKTGDQLQYYIASRQMRNLQLQGCKYYVIGLGNNDWSAGNRTQAQALADMVTLGNWCVRAGGIPLICSLLPRTTSTNGFIDETNQTPTANEAVRLAINASLPSIVGNGNQSAPFFGIVDVASKVCGTNISKWNAAGGIARTGDGTHPNTQGRQDGATAIPSPSSVFLDAA